MKKIYVADISCKNCTNAIEEAFNALEGVTKVSCDLAKKEVYVEGDVSQETLLSALDDLGFDGEIKE